MKKRTIGLILLIIIMGVIGVIYALTAGKQPTLDVDGYVGGEKIGFLEDEQVKEILMETYGINVKYAKAGSLDMVSANLEGKNYLFPSSTTALEYYEDLHGKPAQSEIILNTPIVLYTHRSIVDALENEGMLTEQENVTYIDMEKLVSLILADTQWSEIGLAQLYGKISVDTTDPAKSNSGNMFAALLANVINGGEPLSDANVDEVLPKLQSIFGKLGYMETSSADLFSQFLKMGVGAKPIIAGYESQLIEYAASNPEEYEKIKDDIVILYPAPTVWSTHVLIALDDSGKELLKALQDPKIQEIAWENHGFRTGGYEVTPESREVQVAGVAQDITMVTQISQYEVMKQLIDGLK